MSSRQERRNGRQKGAETEEREVGRGDMESGPTTRSPKKKAHRVVEMCVCVYMTWIECE
jgi:hypothetical protein